MAKISDYLLFAAAKRETRDFILAITGDTRVCKLRDPSRSTPQWRCLNSFPTCKLYGLHTLDVLPIRKRDAALPSGHLGHPIVHQRAL